MKNISQNKKIILHGAFKGDNFGDTLLLYLCHKSVSASGNISVVSNVSENTLKQIDKQRYILGKDTSFNSCDALLYCGGGYFGEQPCGKLIWNLSFLKNHIPVGLQAIFKNKPIGIIGTGAGPLSWYLNRLFLSYIVKKSKITWLRDKESIDFINNLSANYKKAPKLGADLALSLDKSDFVNKNGSRTTENFFNKTLIGVHLSYPSSVNESQSTLLKSLVLISKKYPDLKFIAICDKRSSSQEEAALEFQTIVGNGKCNFISYNSIFETIKAIAKTDLIITNKLHVGIVASAFYIPTLSVANHPKTKRFHAQINNSDNCFLRNEVSGDKITQSLEKLINNRTVDTDVISKLKVTAKHGLLEIQNFASNF